MKNLQSHLKNTNFVFQLFIELHMNICKSLIIALAAVFAAPSMLAAVDADALAASADREPKNAALNLKAGKALFENGDYIKSKISRTGWKRSSALVGEN